MAQFILNERGDAEYVVLPIAEYRALISDGQELPRVTSHTLLINEKSAIKLPYGGPETVLVVKDLIDYLKNEGITHLAINQRAQTLDKYPEAQKMTLDPIIRREFLAPTSPYRNTMQATTDVVDALVATGRFRRLKKRYEFFTKTVNALELID